MRHYIFNIILMLSLGVAFPTGASAQDFIDLYKRFVALASQGSFSKEACDTLYLCYTSASAALGQADNKTKAIGIMRDIVPSLANGAAASQQQGRQTDAVRFARAYVDAAQLPEMSDNSFKSTKAFPQLSYFAAAALVNGGHYGDAIPYLKAYLSTGETKFRETVFVNLIKVCKQAGKKEEGLQACKMAAAAYPDNFNMLSTCINYCIDANENGDLQNYVSKALTIRPNDETLMNLQGKLYEENLQFQKALEVYNNLAKLHPNALDVLKHLAINTYNIGVLNFNKSITETEKDALKEEKKLYNLYFSEAAGHLQKVISQEPSSLKYTQALAVAYNCTGEKDQFEEVNRKLASMGGGRISTGYVPKLITYNQSSSITDTGSTLVASTGNTTSKDVSATSASNSSIPAFSPFAKKYIESIVSTWQQKDPYETLEEYKKRVTEKTRQDKILETKKLAEDEYIRRYSSDVDFTKLKLHPYDAEHGVFLVTSDDIGEMVVSVPRDNNEARLFESEWNGMQFSNPKYFINDDHLALANLTITTPTGKKYRYDNKKALDYTATDVDVHFADIDYGSLTASSEAEKKPTVSHKKISVGKSDVDKDIPENNANNINTFAVIIANEDYDNVASVPMALNDGEIMAKYCNKTLGMPVNNVRLYKNATYGTMLRAVRELKDLANAFYSDINILFYYAGHGIPNESTKDAYLLPTDADGRQTEGCYSLNRLYEELGSTGAKNVLVLLDACFSGAQRDGNMLASARGVALKAKQSTPKGNMVVLSAASGDETALPYSEKGHGLFTYYVLKDLQETKGDATLGQLCDYVEQNVKQQSVVNNHKLQTPTVTPSANIADSWRSIKLKQ